MNRILLLIVIVFSAVSLKAQNAELGCGNGRYINYIFPNVTKTANLIYGYNTTTDYTTATTYTNTLRLDFYEPAGDPAVKRPLIILAFGGGFISGQRSDFDSLCIAFAKKGYATATIDYRLIYPNLTNILLVFSTPALISDEVIKASSDMKAAVRFFKKDAATTNTFKIDPTKIFIGGASAGAILALQAAYTDDINENPLLTPQYLANGGFEGNTDLPAPNNLLPAYNANGIAGVLNIAGGVPDTSLVDANNPPVYSAQGNADEVVPYDYGVVAFNGIPTPITLYGTHLIQTRANNIGLKNQLYTVPGGNHASPGTEPYITQIIAGSSTFLESLICTSVLPVKLTSFTVETNNCAAMLRWQTANEQASSHYDIEASADGIRFIKVGTIQSKNTGAVAGYSYNAQGYSRTAWFRLKMTDKDGGFTYSPIQKFTPACLASLQVYPNPAQARAVVSGLEAGMQVQLINAEGKLLWSQKAAANIVEIRMSGFADGLYLVQVKDHSGNVLSNSKLMKN